MLSKHIEVKREISFKTITEADLFTTSLKKLCQDRRQHFIDIGKTDEYDESGRHPDTCKSSVFSLEEADSLWDMRYSDRSLLDDMGMCIYAYGRADKTRMVFLTDDSMYGWSILKDAGWMAVSFRNRGTLHKDFTSWRNHIDHYYGKEVKVVESVSELLKHLNGEISMDLDCA